MKKILVLVAVIAALVLAASPASAPAITGSCDPVAQAPDVTTLPGYALFRGYTIGCDNNFIIYAWHSAIVDADTHHVLASASGFGYGDRHFDLQPSVSCLRADGSPRHVQDVLVISSAVFLKASHSPVVTCHTLWH